MSHLFERWQSLLNDLRRQGRYRSLGAPRGIDFTSNDYLGYAGRKDCRLRIADCGASGQASRLLRGQHPVWDEVEEALANWHGVEAALVFNSGYAANEGLLSTLLEPQDFLVSDQFNHASIFDGARLSSADRYVFRHNDLERLEEGLRQAERTRKSPRRQIFVVTESLFGMDGDRAPLLEIVDLCERHRAHLIVDEAHATGCFGPGGSGLVAELGLRQRVLATVHTGGKALGVQGAYICGSRQLRELLINCCRHFIFTTALPPTVGHWWLAALGRVQADDAGRAALHAAAKVFRTALNEHGLQVATQDYIVPVLLGADQRAVAVAGELQQAGWDIRAIRPPTVPANTARLRISIHADHDGDTLRAVAAAVGRLATAQTRPGG